MPKEKARRLDVVMAPEPTRETVTPMRIVRDAEGRIRLKPGKTTVRKLK